MTKDNNTGHADKKNIPAGRGKAGMPHGKRDIMDDAFHTGNYRRRLMVWLQLIGGVLLAVLLALGVIIGMAVLLYLAIDTFLLN